MTGTTSLIRWAVALHWFLMKRCSCHWSVCDCLVLFSKADLQSELGDRGYIIFGAVLFIWELLPTSLLILIFRVRQPPRERFADYAFSMPIACNFSLLIHYRSNVLGQFLRQLCFLIN